MTTRPDDPEFEQYLAGGSRVSREYGSLPLEEPPPALDARIRTSAAAAVAVARGPRRATLWWLRPAALAATVLVSFSLMLRLGQLPAPPASGTKPADLPPVQVQVLPPDNSAYSAVPDSAPRLVPPGEIAAAPPAAAERDAVTDDSPAATIVATTQESRVRQEGLAETPMAATAIESERLRDSGNAVAARDRAPGAITPETRFSAATIDRAMAEIRVRVAEKATLEKSQDFTVTARRKEYDRYEIVAAPADLRLRTILALQDQGQADAVAAALADFARDFPDDPLTALLTAAPK